MIMSSGITKVSFLDSGLQNYGFIKCISNYSIQNYKTIILNPNSEDGGCYDDDAMERIDSAVGKGRQREGERKEEDDERGERVKG